MILAKQIMELTKNRSWLGPLTKFKQALEAAQPPTGESSNGRTPDFDSGNRGSNPRSPTKEEK